MSSSLTTALEASPPVSPGDALRELWRHAGMPPATLSQMSLTGGDPVLPSSFAVGTAAQASLGAAALAAAQIDVARGGTPQRVTVDMLHAAQECRSYFQVDGETPEIWDKITGLYPCADGWVRIHANFAHHRDGALRLLGLATGPNTGRAEVEAALREWSAEAFESAGAEAGIVVSAMRSFEQWDAHPQADAIARLPVFTLERIGDAPPRAWPERAPGERPLAHVRVLELTRIIAGPVCGRALAAYGADVMLINAPDLPNISTLIETSRGKLSAHADLCTAVGRESLKRLLTDAHIFVQGYRPGALAGLGFGPHEAAALRPGLVYVSLTAYGHEGPWAGRRGFDSLVQTATGFNHAEAAAAGQSKPLALPVQLLDHASGYLMALGAQAALWRQAQEGGSWHVRVSLAQTAKWVRGLGRIKDGLSIAMPPVDNVLETSESGFGALTAVRHAARFSDTPACWPRPSMPPGTHPPLWPTD
ncbi:CoA transferase [Schauerella aestuarii]|uniref:CoA transferase n=1 Tax=Schauerella aestuarii TaxID=2511204 RepID=UPI00136D78F6|nr:CoA transferase [Achromobacter aestuarii]MYZ44814.1 CoA transferase [Achromobacter aestuarii]